MAEWVPISMTWREFQYTKECAVGTLIQVKLASKEKREYLIGDINVLGGVCDDCMEFDKNSKVLKYKVLFKKDW